MFQPVFVYDSERPASHPKIRELAREKGFRMVDIREVGSTVHGGNPPVIIYDGSGFLLDRVNAGDARFAPPRHVGLMYMISHTKGHVHSLPNPVEFVEWFFGTKVKSWSSFSSNFHLEA